MADEDYILGTSDPELQRLAFQHRVWAEQTHAVWKRAGFGYGCSLLDVGCGPGLATIDLAYLVGPGGSVVAVDLSERFLSIVAESAAAQGLDNVRTRKADAHELGLPDESFDGVYCRWLLSYLADPEAFVAEIARVLRPGGTVAISDYFNYRGLALGPPSAALDRVAAAVAAAWLQRGGDLSIHASTPRLMERHGMEVVDIRQVARIARPGTPLWRWPEMFFRQFLPELVEMGVLAAEVRDEFWADWEERSQSPGSFVCLPPVLDVIGRKRLA